MDKAMLRLRLLLITCILWLGGCAAARSVSESAVASASRPAFLAELDAVDAIQIAELTLEKRSDVARFMEVCSHAHWASYHATMPAKFETIQFMSDGVERHRLLYAGGWLFDTTDDGTCRFGTIHADDGPWVDEHIDKKLMLLRNAL